MYNNLPVTAVGVRAFNGKSSITKVVLPESVTTIHGEAFQNCTSLQTIIMPGVTKIITCTAENSSFGKAENHHFLFCNKLTTIVVGASLSVLAGSGTSGAGQRVFHSEGTGYVAGNTRVYLTSADGILDIFSLSARNGLLNSTPYHYSETRPAEEAQQAITWTYVDGVPTLWADVPVA